MVPWHNRVLLGTTDTPMKKCSLEPRPLKEEIDFLLKHAGKYLTKDPSRQDVLSIFAGLRPLIKIDRAGATAALSRDHSIFVSKSGLVTIAGGKWTTYRKMAEDVINKASVIGGLPERNCITPSLKLHGWLEGLDPSLHFSTYGSHGKEIKTLARQKKTWAALLHPRLPYTAAEVIWSIRTEMARTIEDILARRTRALLLDARATIQIAPYIAQLMAKEMKKTTAWEKKQTAEYTQLAKNYLI
jgi:glycerol-3-phosphate dehydrogenase